jgi:hypothetical protein
MEPPESLRRSGLESELFVAGHGETGIKAMSVPRLLSLLLVAGLGWSAGCWLAQNPRLAKAPLPKAHRIKTENPDLSVADPRPTSNSSRSATSPSQSTRTAPEVYADLLKVTEAFENDDFSQWPKYNRASRRLLRDLPVETLKELMPLLLQTQTKKLTFLPVQEVLSRIAERDPAAALQLLQHPLPRVSQWSQGPLLGKLYADKPEEILALLKSPAFSNNRQVLSSFLSTVAAEDPLGALQLAETQFPEQSSSMRTSIVMAWAQKDPAAAAAYSLKIPEARARNNSIQNVIYRWGTQDLPGALTWTESLPAGPDRQAALSATLSQWAQQNSTEALAYVQAIPDGREKWRMVSNLSYYFAQAEPEAVVSLIESMPSGPEKNSALNNLASRWMQTAPDKAVDLLARQTPTVQSIAILQQGLSRWTQQDPQAALEYALALDPAQRHKVLPGLMEQAAERAPEAAFKAALATYNEDALGKLSKKIASTNPQQALNLASRVPAGKLQDTIIGQTLGVWGQNDPVSAGNYALNLSADTLSRSIGLLAPSLTGKNPAYAKEWALKIPAQNAAAREQAVYQVASSLAKWNWTEADAWRQTLPVGNLRDKATMAQSYPLAERQPAAALNLVLTMANPENRDSTARELFNQWKSKDKVAATQWMRNAGLPESLKKQLNPL